jgi:hypothetical protein
MGVLHGILATLGNKDDVGNGAAKNSQQTSKRKWCWNR